MTFQQNHVACITTSLNTGTKLSYNNNVKNYTSINLLIDHSLPFPQLQALVGGSFSPAEFEDFRSKQTLCRSIDQLNSTEERSESYFSQQYQCIFQPKEMRIKTNINDLPFRYDLCVAPNCLKQRQKEKRNVMIAVIKNQLFALLQKTHPIRKQENHSPNPNPSFPSCAVRLSHSL